MYFSTYGHRNPWLDKFLKSPVSGEPFTSNMVNGPKHCSNLSHSTFAILTADDYCNIFTCNYLRTKNFFSNFFFHFLILFSIFYISKQR